MKFKLTSSFTPTGDQPQAITELVGGIQKGEQAQVLLGVTGSGKTFTVANVIAQLNRPTLVLSHNKTLVAQLYGEFSQFFPKNLVEYFVSYYDYYQPEAYMPVSDTYIEKDLSINEEIDKLRLRATSSLLSGRRDVIVVASVSCIYGMGNPTEFHKGVVPLRVGQIIGRNQFLHSLVDALYSRNDAEFSRATFRVKGDTVDINLPSVDHAVRIVFFDNEIEEIYLFNPISGQRIEKLNEITIFPANLYVAPKDEFEEILYEIREELVEQVEYYQSVGKEYEAKRLEERVNFDIEMMKELGYCSGIENYSRFMDRRNPGDRPFCLLDYFPDDFLLVVDESHVTIPQVGAMYGGDRSRKVNLVEHGFRLPSAMDNRPLTFNEFEGLIGQTIYVSATPAKYELEQSEGVIIEQLIRPTGLLDPPIDVRPSINQIDDLLEEIDERTKKAERVLVTTLTKRMAEELTDYLTRLDIRSRYIHSEVDTLDRVEIIRDLRLGKFDVLVGVNLLREGLDLPEVSLVAVLDADKEGFLRSQRSLTQIAGRAARNANGLVIMYADTITDSMQRTIDETNRRRSKQVAYNEMHDIQPETVFKSKLEILKSSSILDMKTDGTPQPYAGPEELSQVADPVVQYMSKDQLSKSILQTKRKMEKAAKELDFQSAAKYRDEWYALQDTMKERYGEE